MVLHSQLQAEDQVDLVVDLQILMVDLMWVELQAQ